MPGSRIGPRDAARIRGRFRVPVYQRGYRWGAGRAGRLMDDLDGVALARERGERDAALFLQTVTVRRPADADAWELVDGQQRLTTLWLIRACLGRRPEFSLEYDTRPGTAAFLEALLPQEGCGPEPPPPAAAAENADFQHILRARDAILARLDDSARRDRLIRLLDGEGGEDAILILWREAGPGERGADLFARLNAGRIPLTDAELLRASLLSLPPDAGDAGAPDAAEIARDWDSMEADLRDPAFRGFLGESPAARHPTGMDFLLAITAPPRDLPPEEEDDPHALLDDFVARARRLGDGPAGLLAAWDGLRRDHRLLRRWFRDRDDYHLLGWLVAAGAATPHDLLEDARTPGRSRADFEAGIRRRIRAALGNLSRERAAALRHRDHAPLLERILLLFNVESMRRSPNPLDRHPFHLHACRRWSLEHIRARNADNVPERRRGEWIDLHAAVLRGGVGPEPGPDHDPDHGGSRGGAADLLAALEDARARLDAGILPAEDFADLAGDVLAFFRGGDPESGAADRAADRADEAADDGPGNLALLDARHNSALGDALFAVKRARLRELVRAGGYVPPCTRLAFERFYSPPEADPRLPWWDARDRAGLLKAILDVLEPWLPPEGGRE